MYRAPRLKVHLDDKEFHTFLNSVEKYTNEWIKTHEKLIDTSLYIENQDGIQETFDFRTEKSLYNIGSLKFDSHEMLRLAIGSSFFEESNTSVGIFIPLDGKIFTLKLPNIKEIANHILLTASLKG